MTENDGKSMLPSTRSVLIPLIFIVLVVVLIVLTFLGIAGVNILDWFQDSPQQITYERILMDTHVELTFYTEKDEEKSDQIAQKTFAEMQKLEEMFDRGRESSEIWEINENAGQEPVTVANEVLGLIEDSLYYGEKTRGAFDITIAPVMDLWGFYGNDPQLPDRREIEEKLNSVDYRWVELDTAEGTVFLPREGMALDLGGIAKGYVVDRGMEVLKEEGIEHAFVNAGGDIRVIGGKPGEDDPLWKIGIPHPGSEGVRRDRLAARVPLHSSAIATSGDYERFFEKEGERYHHILDPATGYPADELSGVTVIASEAVEADILSTSIFVMGRQEGMELVEELEEVEAVLITPDDEIYYSSGLEDILELSG